MTGVEVVVGAVLGWAWRKTRRAAGHADRSADAAIDAWMQRLHDVVMSRAPYLPAVRALEAEASVNARAGRDSDPPQVRPQTIEAAAADITQIATRDPVFARQLQQLIAQAPPQAPAIHNRGRGIVVAGVGTKSRIHVGDTHSGINPWIIAIVVLVLAAAGGLVALRYLPPHFYQRRVVAACHEAYRITTESHNEVVVLRADGSTGNPDDMVRVDKTALIRVLRDRLARVSAVFDGLADEKVPGTLSARKLAVDAAFQQWAARSEKDIATVRARLRDGSTLTEAMKVLNSTETFGATTAATRLNSTMGALAGGPCTAIGAPVVSS